MEANRQSVAEQPAHHNVQAMQMAVDVLPALERLAYRAMQIAAMGAIDDISFEQMPDRPRRQLSQQCEAFAHSLNPLHRELAIKMASQERTAEGAIWRYLGLLALPVEQLVVTPAAPMPVVTILWKCGQCGALYTHDITVCSRDHIGQHVFPVEAKEAA